MTTYKQQAKEIAYSYFGGTGDEQVQAALLTKDIMTFAAAMVRESTKSGDKEIIDGYLESDYPSSVIHVLKSVKRMQEMKKDLLISALTGGL